VASVIEIPAPLEHQEPIVASPARFKTVRAGRRGGKTVVAEFCSVAGHGPTQPDGDPLHRGIAQDVDVVWVARDYTQAGIMWHEFVRPRFKGKAGVKVNEADRTVSLDGGGTLFVVSAENIASVRGMGSRLGGVVVEEAAWLDLQTALRDVLMPALMDNEGWLLLISTTNAGPDGNPQKETPSYFNRICEEIIAGERSEDWAEFYFTAEDNPQISERAFRDLVAEYAPGDPALEQEVYARLLTGGIGLALDQMSADKHLVQPFPIPSHWTHFGAFDWGFNHPYSFGHFVQDGDGNVYLVSRVKGRQELPDQIAAKVEAAVPIQALAFIAGGHDLKADVRSRGESGPTLKERFMARGWPLVDANISRVSGLNNLRAYTAWRATEDQPERTPRFRIFDTPGNRDVLACLARMQIDEKNHEDAAKVDADHAGNGGDDDYDMVRYGLMSRPMLAVQVRVRQRGEDVNLGADYARGAVIDPTKDRTWEQFERAQRRQANPPRRHNPFARSR
jgi:hypothetical protein